MTPLKVIRVSRTSLRTQRGTLYTQFNRRLTDAELETFRACIIAWAAFAGTEEPTE